MDGPFASDISEETSAVSTRYGASTGTCDNSRNVLYLSWSSLFPKTLSESAKKKEEGEMSRALAIANARRTALAWRQSFWSVRQVRTARFLVSWAGTPSSTSCQLAHDRPPASHPSEASCPSKP